jgi:hypothetical protein
VRQKRELITFGTAVAVGLAGLAGGGVVSAQECHPAYVECVPWVDYDLNCDDLGYSVNLYDANDDPYGLDGWNSVDDGFGCETYAMP